jgi:putative spermidine/putrescine transport system permease protein
MRCASTLSSAIGLDRDIERAALSCGASRFTAFRRVVLPMIRTGVIGGWVLSFIQSFDELTMTIFVATPGTTTLPSPCTTRSRRRSIR